MTTKFAESIETARCFPFNKSRATGTFSTCGELVQVAGYDFLASIHGEIGDWKRNEAEALREWNQEQRDRADQGLTSEINTKVDGPEIADTLERVTALLERHQFGYHIEKDDESPERAEEALALGMELAAAERQQAVAV
jgi:hypothetical protein